MPSASPVTGLHHITCFCSDGRANVRFYRDLLGLRLVKKTVNFDDPTTWHLYYADQGVSVGSTVTFFVIPGMTGGRVGAGYIDGIALDRPGEATPLIERLRAAGVDFEHDATSDTVTTRDPDGQRVVNRFGRSPVDRLGRASMPVRHLESSLEFARRWLGEGVDQWLDIHTIAERGRQGAGSVHHLALSVPDDESHQKLHAELLAAGVHVSPVMDRTYFHSIYFREPGGVLYEVATAHPGFTSDGETLDSLGSRLMLPPWLEKHRAEIEATLPPIE